jgi:hypothetical protein
VAAAATAIALPKVVATTTSVPFTSNGVSDKTSMKMRLLEPRDGCKDPVGKTHRIHYYAMIHHKIRWTIVCIWWTSSTNIVPMPDVLLPRLVPYDEMKENVDFFIFKQFLEIWLNNIHEVAHSLYVKYVYNGVVADSFLGDDLFGVDTTIPLEEGSTAPRSG